MLTPSELPVFILCGGKGTRLREETEFRPKPMVTIGQMPILWHLMKYYSTFGCRDFVLCLGYKAEIIRDFFLNYRAYTGSSKVELQSGTITSLDDGRSLEEWNVFLVDTGMDTLTGLRIQRALSVVPADRFFLTYGDGVANVNLADLLAHHENHGRLTTVTAVHPSSRFGVLDIEGDLARSFAEKPQTDAGWINGGFMVMERQSMDALLPGQNEPLETAVLGALSEREQLSVYRHDGFWQCMDTYREQQLLEAMWNKGEAPWDIWSKNV